MASNIPTKVRFQACQVSTAAQGSFAQKLLLRLGKPESVLWHHLRISRVDSRLPVYATPVVVGGRLRGDAWSGMQLSTPQFRGVLHKPRIGIVPDPFLVKAVWLRETSNNSEVGKWYKPPNSWALLANQYMALLETFAQL